MGTGRIERNSQIENNINNMLDGQPDYIKAYALHIQPLARGTRKTYLTIVIAFMKTVDKNLKDISIEDIERYLSRDASKNGNTVLPKTREVAWSALNSFFKYMYNTGRISDNPVKHVIRKIRNDGESEVRTDYLTDKEIKLYLDTVRNGVGSEKARRCQQKLKERDIAIIELFLLTGMRCSALVGIDVEDIDFDKKIVSTISKGGKYKLYDISLYFDTLLNWLERREELLNGEECNALFVSEKKKRISVRAIENVVNKYAVNINGKHITPHKLRATFGTRLYEKTKDIYFVSQALGHANVNTTKIYIRGQKSINSSAAEIMQKIIKKG